MRLLVLLLVIFSSSAIANDGTQTAYHLSFVTALFQLFDVAFVFIGLVLMLILIVGFFNTVTEEQNNNLMQRMDRSPVTWFRFVIGIVILSGFMFTPMNMATLGGDLVSKNAGDACIVVDLGDTVEQLKSDKSASDCFDGMVEDLSGAIETSEFNQNKMRLFLASVQLIALGFMGYAATIFVLNMAGFKNLSLTPAKSIGVMVASTIVFSSPSIIAYIVDLFNGTNRIMGMT